MICIHHYKLCLNYLIPVNFRANKLCPNNLRMSNSLYRFCVPRGGRGAQTILWRRPLDSELVLAIPWLQATGEALERVCGHPGRIRAMAEFHYVFVETTPTPLFHQSNISTHRCKYFRLQLLRPHMIVIQHALTRLHACNVANLNMPRAKFMFVLTQHRANRERA